jgi:hypothetical protein
VKIGDTMLRSWEPGPADLLVTFVVVTSAVMLLQLVFGAFEPGSALLLSILLCAGAGLLFVRRMPFLGEKRTAVAIVLVGLAVVLLRWSPFLYVEGGQDQGIYVAMSAHFARTHGVPIKDEVRARLPEGEKAEYDKLNNHYLEGRVEVPGRFEGEHQKGIYIADLKSEGDLHCGPESFRVRVPVLPVASGVDGPGRQGAGGGKPGLLAGGLLRAEHTHARVAGL